jgi:hypothetical protein
MHPKVFIGSSVEGKYIADALQANLGYSAWCTIWEHTFPASQVTIDSLIENCTKFDFAIFVFSADDVANMRTHEYAVVRDNVIFEAGLFMGELGKDRVFIVRPNDVNDFHLLTDLSGFTTVTYQSNRARRLEEANPALAPAATNIKNAILRSKWSKLKLDIKAKALSDVGRTYPIKVEFKIKNIQPYPVIIESIEFEINPVLKFASNTGQEQRKPLFLHIEKNSPNTSVDKYKEYITLGFNEKVFSCWLAIDPSITLDMLTQAVEEKKVGEWKYRCIWLQEHVIVCNYNDQF